MTDEQEKELNEIRARVTRLELAVAVLARMAAPLYPLDDVQGTVMKVLTPPGIKEAA